MKIAISDSAVKYINKKVAFYSYQSRKPRIILVAKSCHGAEFRLVFEPPAEEDIAVQEKGLELYLPKALLEEFEGFSLDTELFFFAPRLMVTPLKQSFGCDCAAKCNRKTDIITQT